MRLRTLQALQSDVWALLDEVTGSSGGFNTGTKPAAFDLTEWLNQEWADLYDYLIDADTKWNLQQTQFATVANQDTYGTTVAWTGTTYYKSHGLDVQISGGASPLQWFPAHRFQFEQRNQYVPSAWSWPQRIMYDVWSGTSDPGTTEGTYIKLIPPPPGVFTLRHWWYPAPQRMVNPADAIDGVNGGEQALVFGAAALAAMQTEQWELAQALETRKQQKWARIVSTLRDRNIGEAPMARVVRGRPAHGFGRVGRWGGG
jgi:hypothetical protein